MIRVKTGDLNKIQVSYGIGTPPLHCFVSELAIEAVAVSPELRRSRQDNSAIHVVKSPSQHSGLEASGPRSSLRAVLLQGTGWKFLAVTLGEGDSEPRHKHTRPQRASYSARKTDSRAPDLRSRSPTGFFFLPLHRLNDLEDSIDNIALSAWRSPSSKVRHVNRRTEGGHLSVRITQRCVMHVRQVASCRTSRELRRFPGQSRV
ncbi:hypothetical protein BDN67DRAFT_963243 [Paxillus ammoniavirescens]|nr:hypothetical protein BDN67DRAFT_963243 [Paxillus ammoniavirescens]